METTDFCIIGPGRLGTALAVLLGRKGWRFTGACGRDIAGAERACAAAGGGLAVTDPATIAAKSRLVMITTPDDAIGPVCRAIAVRGGFAEGSVVAHCSGVLNSSVLAPAERSGAHTGSMHPIQSFPTARHAVRMLPGSYCCIEGDHRSMQLLHAMADALQLRMLRIPTDKKPLYHAGAVMASNFLVALLDIAQDLESAAGLSPEEALAPFLPLVRATLENVENLGAARALTGPLARGDCNTVKMHMENMHRHCPAALPAYRSLALRALELGIQQGGVSEEDAASIRQMLGARGRDGGEDRP